jgi:hypothetical protein
MQNVLMDVFNDLRARRLLPVAAVLLVALVAAPIVLSKKSDETTPAPTPTPTPSQAQAPKGPDALAQVKLGDELDQGNGSSLSAFGVSNPFAPPKDVTKGDETQTQPTDTTGVSPTTSTGGTGTTGGTGEGTGGGESGGGESGGGESGGGEKTTEFAYVLDVTFWSNGHKRTIKGMEKLDTLPNMVNPLLIFMGVSGGGGNGVFLVDATLQTTGEGKCKPSRSDCAFLYLGAGSEQEFTNEDGDSYRLRIDQIRKVKVGNESNDSADAASHKKSKSASAAVQKTEDRRRFVPPILTDLVEVTTGGGSTDDEERR